MNNDLTLQLTEREAQALFRGLLEYRDILIDAAKRDYAHVRDDLKIVDDLSNRIWLNLNPSSGERNVLG